MAKTAKKQTAAKKPAAKKSTPAELHELARRARRAGDADGSRDLLEQAWAAERRA